MKLRFVILAEKIALDWPSFSPCAFNIVDDLELVAIGPDGKPVLTPGTLPFTFTLLTTWAIEDGDEKDGVHYSATYKTPDGTEKEIVKTEVKFGEKRRFYSRVNIDGLPYTQPGDYRILIYTGESKEPVGEWRIRIALLDQPPGQSEL